MTRTSVLGIWGATLKLECRPTLLLLLLLLLLDSSELALLRAILILRRTAPIAVTVGLCSPASNPCV